MAALEGSQAKLREQLSRARFYGILDTGYLAQGSFAVMCQMLLDGGADIIQVRAKGVPKAEYRALLERVLPLFEDNEVPLIVNDHLDVALDYPRCGLHIGQDDVSVKEARKALGPGRVLGLSTHSVAQAQAALELADQLTYFCIGPVFPTGTKPDYKPVGLQLVTDVSRLNDGRLPLFCIGGIKRDNVQSVIDAGAERVVVVSEALLAENPAALVRDYRQALGD